MCQVFNCFLINSYLQSILPAFNKCVDVFINKLTPLADGKTPVPMKEHLAEVTLDVISKVENIWLHAYSGCQKPCTRCTHIQVAFGSDFTEKWSDQHLGLHRAKGNGSILFLLENSFKGLQKRLFLPWYQVYFTVLVLITWEELHSV